MAIIYSYPQATVKPSDRILASDTTQTGNPTINITVGGIAKLYSYTTRLWIRNSWLHAGMGNRSTTR